MNVIKKNEGFTLIELIIVIAILAVLVGIAIPNILGSVEDTRKATDVASAKIIADGAARILAMEGKYSGFVYDGLNISTIDASFTPGNITEEFEAELFKELNQDPPVPKFKNVSVDADNYILFIDSNRIISIYVGSGNTTTDAIRIFPDPVSEYDYR